MSLPWSGKVSNAPGAICRRKRSFLPKMPMASSTDQSRSLVTFLYRCRFRIVVKKLVSSRCSSFYRLVADLTTHPSFGKIAGAILPKSTFPVQGRLGYEDRPSPPSSYVDSITEGAKHLPVGEGLDACASITAHKSNYSFSSILSIVLSMAVCTLDWCLATIDAISVEPRISFSRIGSSMELDQLNR